MGLSILKSLAILNLAIFLVVMLFTTGDKNRIFVKYILLSYPVLALYIIPVMTGFEMIPYIFLIFFYKRKNTSFRAGTIYTVLFIILLLIIIIGAFTAESLGGEFITDLISFFPIFIYCKILIDELLEDPSFFYTVISCLKITLIVSLVFLCCQFVLGVEFSLSKTQNPNIVISGGFRYPSFLSDPQTYAQFLAAMSFICLIRDYKAPKLPMKNYILALLALVAILSTGGRAALLGWALGLFIVVLFGNSNYRVTVIITCISLYLIAYNFSDSFAIFKRSGDMSETYDFRAAIWQDAFTIFTQNPFFGIGLGNYAHYVSLHNPDQFWLVENEFVYFDHPESGYLKFLTELGLTGFISIFLLILIPIFKGFILYFKTWDTSIILLIAAVVSWMVAFYSTYSFGEARIKILVVTIICLLITSHKRLSQEYEYDE
jgi:O-antigen ligase